jgi:hypothetical protein
LPWEAKKLLSSHYKEEEYVYSYSIIKENPISIILAVTPLSLLNNHLSLFDNTGIKPDAVYTNVFSSLALQSIVDIAGLPALSIVDFGYSGTHLNIYSTGKIKFYRYIPTGTSELSNPPSENELEMYSQKIRFSFDYFRAVSKLSQVDALFFMGGGSTIPNVMDYEQNYFSPTKINPIDISSALDISPVISENMNESGNNERIIHLSPFIPAIGSCLADFRNDSEKMNLLALIKKQEEEKHLEKLSNMIPLVVGLIAFIISTVILFYNYTETNNNFINKLNELEKTKKEIENKKEELITKKANTIRLRPESLEIVRQIIEGKDSLRYFFDILYEVKPKNIQISEVLIRNREEAENIFLKSIEEIESEKDYSNQESESESDKNILKSSSQNKSNDMFDIFSEPEKNTKNKQDIQKNNKILYTSELSQPLSEEQIKKDFDGNIIIIHGYSKSSVEVSEFTKSLITNPLRKLLYTSIRLGIICNIANTFLKNISYLANNNISYIDFKDYLYSFQRLLSTNIKVSINYLIFNELDAELVFPKPLLGYISINTRLNNDTIEFLLKGELK